jgi:hypothetical protein
MVENQPGVLVVDPVRSMSAQKMKALKIVVFSYFILLLNLFCYLIEYQLFHLST